MVKCSFFKSSRYSCKNLCIIFSSLKPSGAKIVNSTLKVPCTPVAFPNSIARFVADFFLTYPIFNVHGCFGLDNI